MISKIIGFVFIVFGVVVGSIDKWLCKSLCKTCLPSQLFPCIFLFLFVGLIFIIAGYSLILMEKL